MSHYVGRQEILGREEIMGSALSKTVGAIKKVAGLPLDAAAWALRRTPVPSKSMFIGREEIMGAFVGDEARALAEDTRGERAAARRSGTCGYNSHWNYIKGELPELSPADLVKVQDLAQKGNKKARRLLAKMGKLTAFRTSEDKLSGDEPIAPSAVKYLTAAIPRETERVLADYRKNRVIDPATRQNLQLLVTTEATLYNRKAAQKAQHEYDAIQDLAKKGDPKALARWANIAASRVLLSELSQQYTKNQEASQLLDQLKKVAVDTSSGGEDNTLTDRQRARQILKAASAGKSISRAELKNAIWLYAGKQSTEKERTLVGSKMLQFLNQRQVKLAS